MIGVRSIVKITEDILKCISSLHIGNGCSLSKSLFILTDRNLISLYKYVPINTTNLNVENIDPTKLAAFNLSKLRNITICDKKDNLSSLATPIHKSDGQIIGFLGVVSSEKLEKSTLPFIESVSKWLSAEVSNALPEISGEVNMSDTETEIVNFIRKGNTDLEIAKMLHISRSTVRVHIQNLFSKYDAKNRSELIAKYLDYMKTPYN